MRGIVFSTRQPSLAYVRTDIGGANRWDPRTGRWTPLLDWIGPTDWNLTGAIIGEPTRLWSCVLLPQWP